MGEKPKVPAIEGWFTLDAEPHLLGTHCTGCGSYFFPKTQAICGNPVCSDAGFEEVELSRTGRIWSYTSNEYPPPAPYVSPDPFVPYTVAAVELEREKMVVLGQVPPDVDVETLAVGTEVELEIGPLYADDDNEYLMWNWRPVAT